MIINDYKSFPEYTEDGEVVENTYCAIAEGDAEFIGELDALVQELYKKNNSEEDQ